MEYNKNQLWSFLNKFIYVDNDQLSEYLS